MAKLIRVCIFPAGEINALELHDALASCVNIDVYGVSSVDRHGSYVFANYSATMPRITDPDFLDCFGAWLRANAIDVVFPTHDSVALYLAQNANAIPAVLITADARTARICRNKALTYRTFADTAFVPRVFHGDYIYPVFVKPLEGQGGVGAYRADAPSQLPDRPEDYVITEYLPGEEYTVDCLTDRQGRLRVVCPRSRLRVMAGISVAGATEACTSDIAAIAQTINARCGFLGLWWFQIKRDIAGEWKLLEISTRCAGTMALTRATGVNLPLLSVYTALGHDIVVHQNACPVVMDSALIRRYRIGYAYDTVYMDFDDTLIVRGKVFLKCVWFLYQCRNAGKNVILLTRHDSDIEASLARYAIDKNLFATIIHLDATQSKADCILPNKAIFVDNAWKERQKIAEAYGIPVFDVDGLDALLDWRY